MGLVQWWAQKYVARRDVQRIASLRTRLVAGEVPRGTCIAKSIDAAELFGRHAGEGTFVVTNKRIIFRPDVTRTPGPREHSIPLGLIAKWTWTRGPTRRLVMLRLIHLGGSPQDGEYFLDRYLVGAHMEPLLAGAVDEWENTASPNVLRHVRRWHEAAMKRHAP